MMYKALLTLLFLLSCSLSQAEQKTRVVHESLYKAKFGSISVNMKRKLIDMGNGVFRLHAKAKNFWGSVEEHEDFSWDKQGKITPISYYYKQSTIGIKRQRDIHYDWQTKTASINYKKKQFSIPLSEGMLGPMTYQLQLQLDLIKQNQALEYTFIHKNRLKNFSFEVEEAPANQSIENASASSLIKLKRKNEDAKKTTQIWFDPKQHYVLSYLNQSSESKVYSLSLRTQSLAKQLIDTPYEALVKQTALSK